MKRKLAILATLLGLILVFSTVSVLATVGEKPDPVARGASSPQQGSDSKISVEINGTTTYYNNAAEGWSAATEASNYKNPATVILLADWTAKPAANIGTSFGSGTGFSSGYLTVDTGKFITLDLNGYALNRALDVVQNYSGYVINNSGTLTIQDSSPEKKGTIKGGFAYKGGGIYQNRGGTLTITGGTITGNQGTSGGGGLYIFGGNVTMIGGTITSNIAQSGYGGGIHMNGGTFTMTGGTITSNTVKSGNGGGIYSANSTTFKVSGAPTITGNTAGNNTSNVYLPRYKFVTIGGKMTGGSIGITSYILPNDETPTVDVVKAATGYTIIADDAKCFSSDATDYYAALNTDTNTLQLRAKVMTIITLDAGGGTAGTITSVKGESGAALPALTKAGELPTRDSHTFNGYYDAKTGGTQYYKADGSSAKNWDKSDKTATLYAQWTFVKQDINITHNPQTTTYDGKTYDLGQLFTMPAGHGEATYEIEKGGTGTGTVSGSTLTITKAGTFNIKVTTAESDQYKPGDATVKLTVNKGKLPLPTGATLTYTGKLQTGVAAREGFYTVSGNTGTDVGGYTATAALTDGAKALYNWNTAVPTTADQGIKWSIIEATPTINAKPTASAITYGQSLSESKLIGGTAKLGNTEVPGRFRWKDGNATPAVNAGDQEVVFTPQDETNLNTVALKVSVKVKPMTTTIGTKPTASAITYGESLSKSTLTGGTAVASNGTPVEGTFAWKTGTDVPAVDAEEQAVIFTPTDSNYSTVEGKAPVTVNQKALTPSLASVDNKTYDGTTKGSGTVTLTGAVSGDAPTATGTITWTNKSAGTSTVNVTNITLGGEWTTNYKLPTTALTEKVAPSGVTIAPLPVKVTWDYKKAFVYDGTSKAVIPTVTNAVDKDVINPIVQDGSKTDAGNYTVKLTQLSNNNYTLTGASGTTLDWQILSVVTFDADGGKETPTGQNVAIGAKITDPGSVTKEDYALGGWYNGDTKWDFGKDTVRGNKIVLKAKWLHTKKAITSFSIGEKQGTIDENAGTITFNFPEGSKLTDLAATFKTSEGATVKIGDTVQQSGVTTNDFTNNLTYSVYSQGEPKANPKNYTVKVNILKSPVIGGIVAGGNYHTTQIATITGEQITSVTLNGTAVSLEKPIKVNLLGNVEKSYHIVATNVAGGKSEITVTMELIESLKEPIDKLNESNVKSTDKATVESVKKEIEKEAITNATDDEKSKLKAIENQCDSLIKKINQVQKDTEEAKQIAGGIRPDNVQLGDKAALEKSKSAIEKVLADNPDNYTLKEKEALEGRLAEIQEAIIIINHSQSVIDKIDSLPDVGSITLKDAQKIRSVQAAYDALTAYEKRLVGKAPGSPPQKLADKTAKLKELQAAKANKGKETGADQSSNAQTDDPTNLAGAILLCVLALSLGGGCIYSKKKH